MFTDYAEQKAGIGRSKLREASLLPYSAAALRLVTFFAACFCAFISVLPDTAICQQRSSIVFSHSSEARKTSVRIRALRADGAAISGAGFIFDAAGHVITSSELVDGARRLIVVGLGDSDGGERPASLTGIDRRTGIAVLKIEGYERGKVAVRFGEGEIATPQRIGCATCRSDRKTVVEGSLGPLQGYGRNNPYETLAPGIPVDRHALGSALFGQDGTVLAMISVVGTTPDGQLQVLALPARTLERVGRAIVATGKVDRGWLGANVGDIDEALASALHLPQPRGALVISLVPGGPASRSLLQIGDIITAVGPVSIAQPSDVVRAVSDEAPGVEVPFQVLRQGKAVTVAVRLGDLSTFAPSQEADTGMDVPAIGMRLQSRPESKGIVVVKGPSGIPSGATIVSMNTKPVSDLGGVNREIAVALAKGRDGLLLHLRVNGGNKFEAVDLQQPPR